MCPLFVRATLCRGLFVAIYLGQRRISSKASLYYTTSTHIGSLMFCRKTNIDIKCTRARATPTKSSTDIDINIPSSVWRADCLPFPFARNLNKIQRHTHAHKKNLLPASFGYSVDWRRGGSNLSSAYVHTTEPSSYTHYSDMHTFLGNVIIT